MIRRLIIVIYLSENIYLSLLTGREKKQAMEEEGAILLAKMKSSLPDISSRYMNPTSCCYDHLSCSI